MERLQEQYNKKIIPSLKEKFGYANIMQVPKILKVVVNVGLGTVKEDKKKIDAVVADLAKITGQAPVRTKAKKSIAGFKVRENQIVGAVCTLRGFRMYSFLDKLINTALPRVRDFQGIDPKNFDGRGSLHLGIKEHLVFPEISPEALEHVFGLEVSIVTNAGRDDAAKELLSQMKFPFKNNKDS
ncbi:MAG: 50S ribosomal protein L5 [Candidatus Doudnabacteria bacterium CG10_big_fil_rev_8_21_14_0_10_42_18]|uniref:Large ribosomal subunit protein uL5 n=1 Tax=Candidatus Doudnabacteria bacterium CG10_big_fil_rev_8_21_14_0_10_42_18 TaxID=1974552 RepID=A0A2H0VBG7_9BACT|nr:MAG: 50S ribosomal protein L5 [Candidatus Doudnabacteria bacterium CG10_big_fil_rev_8_21_14_0_10_42_18]